MPTQTEPGSKNVVAAQWSTAQVNDLPDSSFAYIESGGKKDSDGKTTPRSLRHLPYKDASGKVDLPHTRNALARLNQTQGIPAGEKDSIRTKLQNALKNAKASDDVSFEALQPILADDQSQELPSEIMLLRAGDFNTQKYGEIPLTDSDLAEMAENFRNGVGMAADGSTGLPIDFSHKSGEKAAGWIKGMEVRGKELWGTALEWSRAGKEALLGKEFKMLSSDFYPRAFGEWVDPESGIVAQNVMTGAALTNRPMFTGNQPVIASDTSPEGKETNKVTYVLASQDKKEDNMNIDELRVKEPKDLNGEQYKFLADNQGELSADELTKFGFKAEVKAGEEGDEGKGEGAGDGKQPKSVKASEIKGDEGKVLVEASEVKGLNDRIGNLEAAQTASETEKVKGQVLEHVKRGAIRADRVDSWTKRIMAAQGDDRKELLDDLAGIPDNKAMAPTQGSGDGAEGDGSDPRSKFMNKVTEKVEASAKTDKPLSWDEAKEAVRKEDPELAAQAAESGRERVAASAAVPTPDQLTAAGVNGG